MGNELVIKAIFTKHSSVVMVDCVELPIKRL
jgi:hypothetical protein